MISSAADYEFVTGITNGEVVIDGDILPVRDTYQDPEGIQQPRCLRGEDVAFLMEAANERNGVIAGNAEVTAFDRKVSGAQLATICTNLHRHLDGASSANTPCYFKSAYVFAEKWADPDLEEYAYFPYGDDMYYVHKESLSPYSLYPDGVLRDRSANPGDFLSQGVLRLDHLRNLFEDVSRQRRVYCGNPGLVQYRDINITTIFQRDVHKYTAGAIPSFFPKYGPFDGVAMLFANICSSALDGIYETNTLTSFALDLQVPVFSAGHLSSVTVLATVVGVMGWQDGFVEEKQLTMPLTATLSNGKWVLAQDEMSRAVDKVLAAMSRPTQGSNVWQSADYCLDAIYMYLVAATPIVVLDDHTSF